MLAAICATCSRAPARGGSSRTAPNRLTSSLCSGLRNRSRCSVSTGSPRIFAAVLHARCGSRAASTARTLRGPASAKAKVPRPEKRSAIVSAPARYRRASSISTASPSGVGWRKLPCGNGTGTAPSVTVSGSGSHSVSGPKPLSSESRASAWSRAKSSSASVAASPSAAMPLSRQSIPWSASVSSISTACRPPCAAIRVLSGVTSAKSSGVRIWHSRISTMRCEPPSRKPSTALRPVRKPWSVARRRDRGGDRCVSSSVAGAMPCPSAAWTTRSVTNWRSASSSACCSWQPPQVGKCRHGGAT